MSDDRRPQEVSLPFDPGAQGDAEVTFIGTLSTDWAPGTAPKNLTAARARGGGGGSITLLPAYRPGLLALKVGQAIWLILWFDRARRDLIIQAPRHADGPRGTFALRSPVRPNPIALEMVRITGLDPEAGRIEIDATDAFDGTPVLDIKPWLPAVDVPQ